jgi:hypothetical protein
VTLDSEAASAIADDLQFAIREIESSLAPATTEEETEEE